VRVLRVRGRFIQCFALRKFSQYVNSLIIDHNVFFLAVQGEIVKDGERCFALIPKIIQEMDTDGTTALLVVWVGNVALLGKVILEAA
jgi:hypothetical protein